MILEVGKTWWPFLGLLAAHLCFLSHIINALGSYQTPKKGGQMLIIF